jgi:hypothetical protein
MLFNVTFNNIVPVTLLIGGGNQSTWRKPLTHHKSLDINLIQSLVPYKENIWSYMCLLKTEEISQYHVLVTLFGLMLHYTFIRVHKTDFSK